MGSGEALKGKEKEDTVTKGDGKKKEKKEEAPQVSFFSLFRYAGPVERCLMIFGTVAAIGNGAIMPAFSILFGQIQDVFVPSNFEDPNYNIENSITPIALYFLYVGIAGFVLSYIQASFWMLAGERQIKKVRENYLKAVLRQEVGWFDVSKPSELSTRIASDTATMQEGVGEKVGSLIQFGSTFVSGFVIGFVQGWQLTLVILAVSPLLAAGGGFMAYTLSSMTKKGLEAYAGAGGVAEESISNIRTVTTFNGQRKEGSRYTTKLKEAEKVGIKKGLLTGVGMGAVMGIMFGAYALSFWFGSKLISDHTKNSTTGKPWTGGDVVTTFFAVIMGAFALGQAGPSFQAIASGRAAAYKIFAITDRVSLIDPFDETGEKPASIQGDIEFRNVHFSYPSRSEVPVLRDLSLSIPHGQTVALVGESGCGKSTTVALLEKFYLASEGSVMIDGRDVAQLNTRWLRQRLGLVSQEPQLFATSIANNIRFGKEDATMDEIIEAAKAANAHDFISRLPKGYDTHVGEKGVQMSGGQKQRIAIARAIIKNPSVLLLDEATSALDTENERLVQEALDRMMVGRTTIVIAHRLATVKNADKIVVFKEGRVAEEGKHDELMALNGLYYNLVQRQTSKKDEDGKDQPNQSIVDGAQDDAKFEETHHAISVISQNDPEKGETKLEKGKAYPFSLRTIAKESKPETGYVVMGVAGAVLNGMVMPIMAIIFSEILAVFQRPDPADVRSGSRFLSIMFVVLGIAAFTGNFVQMFSFAVVGEKLTFRLRDKSFKAILRQNIGWFDEEKNSTGVLATKLATDATLVQGVTTQRVSLMVQNIATIVGGLVIAFVAGWKLTLVILACMPFVAISGSITMKVMKGFSEDALTAYEKAGSVSTEAVGGIRTIASFTREEILLDMYSAQLEEPMRLAVKRAHISGLGFGFSQFCMLATNALAFWFAGRLLQRNEWPASSQTITKQCYDKVEPAAIPGCIKQQNAIEGFKHMMRVLLAILMSGMSLGQASSFAPDAAKASAAASSIYELLDRKPPIDVDLQGGGRVNQVQGNIELRDVHFSYPTRPNVQIFQGFNLIVPAGKTVALVGDSGGGKSTVISLLERFYEPAQGSIFLDGSDIKSLDLRFLRSQISLVSQEPSLFSTTIAKNIAYGKEDATLDEIEAAAKMANCHNFITALPEGYNTLLGDKYVQLSGGQKQRVAIARALLCNPKVMLLDEATSALDSESERLVQEALERVMEGRTTIVIAHRLSTIINADIIAVMKGGQIVELGNHAELLAHGKHYSNLVKRQL